ncbi:MAG: acetolactate synthase small subunit [Coriobacteriales bacterium]
MSRVLSVWVDNKPGVLARIAGLVSRRGFNIESLAVSNTEEDVRSRVTMVVDADEHIVEQVTKQLHKLINVYKVTDLTDMDHIERELVLFKVDAPPEKRGEIIELAKNFGAKIDGGASDSLIIELTETAGRLEAFETLLSPYGIREMIRTGKIALAND